jgi:hypothetical protein
MEGDYSKDQGVDGRMGSKLVIKVRNVKNVILS